MFIQNEEVFKVFKTLLSLNSDYLINKIESTNKIKSNVLNTLNTSSCCINIGSPVI